MDLYNGEHFKNGVFDWLAINNLKNTCYAC